VESPNTATESIVPVSSDWGEMFYNTVGFYPPRGETPPAAPPAQAQPPASGQGSEQTGGDEGSKGDQGGVNWDLFPDVAEDQRVVAEPIARQMQGHVTRLEQQLAPLKPLFDQGLDVENVAALGGFAVEFNQDPTEAWLNLARRMQSPEVGLLPPDLDLDAVAAAASGQGASDSQGEQQPAGPGQAEGANPEVAELARRLQAMEQATQQRQVQERQAADKQALDQALDGMRSQLQEAKVPEPGEELLVATLIATNGDTEKAVQMLIEHRNNGIKDLAQQPTGGGSELEMPKGAPKSGKKSGRKGGPWGTARDGAAQMLKSRNQAQAAG
jgi:hypothetical protein